MSMNEKWAAAVGGRVEFDVELFDLSIDERLALYCEDPIEELYAMSVEERIARYGRDYNEYL
jgi:hypothetical protein